MIEAALTAGQRFPWCAAGTPTTARLTQVDGRYFVAEFDRTTGELVTASGPPPAQAAAMRKLLK
jgi:hypothetical protein